MWANRYSTAYCRLVFAVPSVGRSPLNPGFVVVVEPLCILCENIFFVLFW